MKTKTIYHLDRDCNIVSIEVINKKKKKKCAYQDLEKAQLESIFKSSRAGFIPQDEIEKQRQLPFQKTPIQKELSIDQLRDKLFPNFDNSNKSQELVEFLLKSTTELRLAVKNLEETDKKYRHQLKNDLRRAGRNVASEATTLIWILDRVLPKLIAK